MNFDTLIVVKSLQGRWITAPYVRPSGIGLDRSTQHPPITLNSTLRSSASVASSRPVPIRLSRAPMPLAMVRSVSAGSSWPSRVFTYSARRSDRRSFSGAGPVGLVWPATSRQDGALASPRRDGVEPAVVIPAHLRIRDERRRSRPEQEFDRQPVVAQPVIDDIAERLCRVVAQAQLQVRQIDPVIGPQLVARPRLHRRAVQVQRAPGSGRRRTPRSRRLSGTRSRCRPDSRALSDRRPWCPGRW